MKTMFTRLLEADPNLGAGGGNIVPESYAFGQVDGKDLPAEQVTALSAQAKSFGLSQEQAAKALPHLLKSIQPAAVQVPDSYKFEQVEGKDLPAEFVTEISATAKALGLNAEQAQKFAVYERNLRNEAKGETDKQLASVKTKWGEELAADTEVGGTKLPATLALGKTALEKFFPDIAKNEAGFPFLSHPAVVKGLAAIGKAISPDGDFVRDKGNSGNAEGPARLLYPTMFKAS